MIKITHAVFPSPEQMIFAVEAMRNPMNSFGMSKSQITVNKLQSRQNFILGHNDEGLMQRLCVAGTEHRKFMRQMPVGIRITAPIYWWKEADTYKVGTTRNSTSTMHKITSKEFVKDDFSFERCVGSDEQIDSIIEYLNVLRDRYLQTKDKAYWETIIQILPSSYNQTSNITLNYEVLANIYKQRKGHKLKEWNDFCDWIEKEVPYSWLITRNKQ